MTGPLGFLALFVVVVALVALGAFGHWLTVLVLDWRALKIREARYAEAWRQRRRER